MKKLFLLVFFTLLVSYGIAQEYSKKELRYKPVNLEEAIAQLKKLHHDSIKQEILSMTEDEFMYKAHHGMGTWIRNNWGLWRKKKLAKYFNALGIFHPDDMSSIILKSYYRDLHQQELKVDELIKYYQDYWKKIKEHNHRLINDSAFALEQKEAYENLIKKENEGRKKEFPIGTQVKAWVEYSIWGKSSPVIGEVLEWRELTSKSNTTLNHPGGPKLELEYLEVKIKILEYEDLKKKERIKTYQKIKNEEVWVNGDSIKKIEQ